MTCLHRLGFLALACASLLPTEGGEQGAIRTRVDGVRVDVLVSDKGQPLDGLTPADFEVQDDGVVQNVDAVSSAGVVSVVLLVDTSFSVVQTARVGALVRAAAAVTRELVPGDQASLVIFSDEPRLIVDSTTDFSRLRQELEVIRQRATPRRHEPTAIWDAVLTASSLVAEKPGRPVVVLMSDGADNASWLLQTEASAARWMTAQRERTIEALQGAGVALEVLWVPHSFGHDDGVHGPMSPVEPARAMGGMAFSAADARLAERVRARLAALRSGYVLTFTPTGVSCDGSWHELKVRLKRRSARIDARDSYRCYSSAAGRTRR